MSTTYSDASFERLIDDIHEQAIEQAVVVDNQTDEEIDTAINEAETKVIDSLIAQLNAYKKELN